MIQKETPDIALSSEAKRVQRFFKQLYHQHRLNTPATEHFRSVTLGESIEVFTTKYGITSEDFFVIPLGSAKTLPDDHSDLDIIVVLNSDSLSQEQIESLKRRIPAQSEVNQRKIEVHHVFTSGLAKGMIAFRSFIEKTGHKLSMPVDEGLIAELVLTPDSLIVGNVELAQRTRKAAVKFIDEIYNVSVYWPTIQQRMEEFVLKWPENQIQGREKKDPERSRKVRFDNAVKRVVLGINQKHPKKEPGGVWQEKFIEYLDSASLPLFDEYKQAILERNGAL